MAIKDIIVPGFVGTSTIKWIVTRGFTQAAAPVDVEPDDTSLEYTLPGKPLHYNVEGRLHYSLEND